jgi:hypothetical protein
MVLAVMAGAGAFASTNAQALGAHVSVADRATVAVGSPQGFAWCGLYFNDHGFGVHDNLCVVAAELGEEPGTFQVTVSKVCGTGPIPRTDDGCQSGTESFLTPTDGFSINEDTGTVQADISYTALDGPTTLHLVGAFTASRRLSNADSLPFEVAAGAGVIGPGGPPLGTVIVSAASAIGTVKLATASSISFGGVTYTGISGAGDAWNDASTIAWLT